jgi:hypothetical protein
MIEVNEARGAVGDPGKTARVRAMRARLIRIHRGEEQPAELWDPIHEQGHGEDRGQGNGNGGNNSAPTANTQVYPSLRHDPGKPWRYGFAILGAALAAVLLVSRTRNDRR